ncbi:T9SS type A sorting domain-containing protein [Mariniflexile maritimum]|uniref:T9SS type A sorting domain-containing protein n=1 Tax=Mariniflexile maritimum TaxID=2682493 RepID=UPI0012F6C15C|nr:T9SS type A sorting domain-containing protein [Mariniflexile maritimum]
MKKTLLLLSALALSISSSYGQLLMYEPFSYTDAAQNATNELILSSSGTWVAGPSLSTGSTTNDDIVTSPFDAGAYGIPTGTGESYFFRGGGNDPVRSFTPQTTGTVYWSALIRVEGWIGNGTTQYAPGATGKQVFSLTNSYTSSSDISYPGSLIIKGASTTLGETSYQLGVGNQHIDDALKGSYASTIFTSSSTDHLVVLSYDIATATTKLWIDPAIPANGTMTTDLPSATITGPGTVTEISRFFIRLDSNANTPNMTIDEIRVAKTWHEVVGKPAPLSVSKNNIEGLKIYPNPAKDYISIESKNTKISSVEMYNVLGAKVISEKALVNNRLNVSHLSKGIYMLKVNAENGSATKKILID